MENKLIIIAGHFGSGKTEFSINLALKMAKEMDKEINLIDLDFVNPYFRSRRFRDELKKMGVHVEEPENRAIAVADIPSISGSLLGKIEDKNRNGVVEVGGDKIGSKVLGSLETQIKSREYEFYAVFNCFRPDTDSVEKVKEMIKGIEEASKLKVKYLISNCHLKEITDEETILHGLKFTTELEENYLPVKYFCVADSIEVPKSVVNSSYEIFPIKRFNTYCYEEGKYSGVQI